MSAREHSRYMTAAVVFGLAFVALGVLFVRSMGALAQDFTWRPQTATTNVYQGGDADTCETTDDISSTQRLGQAFDSNSSTAATSYTDANISTVDPGMKVGEEDTTFTESGKWSSFEQTTTFIEDVNLFVTRQATNNQAYQWNIEYTVKGPTAADADWNEMVRFTVQYDDTGGDSGEANLSLGDEIINTTKSNDVGYILSMDTTDPTNQLTLERYFPGQFANWDPTDAIENADQTFVTTVTAFDILADPPKEDLGEAVTNNPRGGFLTEDESDTNFILDSLDTELAVRTRSRQEGCNTEPNQCPLCGVGLANLAKLDIFDIRVEAEWDETNGGAHPLRIDTLALPDGVKGVSYDETVDASGGNTLYSWELLDGNLDPCPPETADDICGEMHSTGDPDYHIYGSNPLPASYTFTLKVTDTSDPPQTAQRQFSFVIAGVAISPDDPNLSATVEPPPFDQDFAPCDPVSPCGTSPYDWCLVSSDDLPNLTWTPSVPLCPSTVENTTINLSGQADNAGDYRFKLRLTDGAGETAEKEYTLKVSTTNVRILSTTLKPMVKGMEYRNSHDVAATYQRMEAQNLQAVRVASSTLDWAQTGLTPLELDLLDDTLDTVAQISRTYIVGEIPIGTQAGDYSFSATVTDTNPSPPPDDFSHTLTLPLRILDRKTVLVKTPPSTVKLPSDHTLQFTVFAEGGAPSKSDDTALDGKSVPYYNYNWEVTPAPNTESPELDASYASGTDDPSTPVAQPYTVTITFKDSDGKPVAGTYDVTFWAEDVISRAHPPDPSPADPPDHPVGTDTNDDYEFTPATVRIKVNPPAEVERRPIKRREEIFR